MKRELEFLEENITDNSKVIIACSGGPDSMCLLNLLIKLKEKKNLELIVAHVNHKLRSVSDNEAKMVEDYAKKNKVTFELQELDYQNTKFSEDDAHRKRYKFFKSLIKKYKANYLVTAHHGDDLIETILMRIARGSNLNGYIGIKRITQNEDYVTLRPLLSTTKDEIIKYNESENIPYVIDESNDSLKYTRNRYRKNVLPFLKNEDEYIHLKYLKFSEELEEYDNFVNNYIKEKEFIVDNQIVINKITNESEFIKRKTIELIVKSIQVNDYFNISDKQMNELLKLIYNSNKSIDLNNNYIGINEYGYLKIIKKPNKEYQEIILDKDLEFLGFNFYYNCDNGNSSNNCIYLNSSEVTLPLKLRTRCNGDKMQVLNLGTKKINDIFIDNKINKELRSNYPILVDAKNNIIWLPSLKKSQFCKDKSEKYDIIIKCEAR
ncbi:MAG TPA: tRNA lysidine(34) synthetase TilS [Candidatus Onthocola stercorigallinarum]|nr:tRNA lysidine(34) synthetase TilS [Candidatus Onthocola stercorigallinarum]